MMYDDDALDRALAALPLEESPAGLRARIMAATVDAPVVAPAAAWLPGWELWLTAVLATLGAWLAWLFVATPNAVDQLTAAIDRTAGADSLTSASTLLWAALGISAAWWISGLSVPHAQRIRVR